MFKSTHRNSTELNDIRPIPCFLVLCAISEVTTHHCKVEEAKLHPTATAKFGYKKRPKMMPLTGRGIHGKLTKQSAHLAHHTYNLLQHGTPRTTRNALDYLAAITSPHLRSTGAGGARIGCSY